MSDISIAIGWYNPLIRGIFFIIFLFVLFIFERRQIFNHHSSLFKGNILNNSYLYLMGQSIQFIIFFILFNVIYFTLPSLVSIAIYYEKLGLMNNFSLPLVYKCIMSVVLLDFFMYLQHRLMHQIKFLNVIHAVHHTDRKPDFSTGLRFHPIELMIFTFFKCLGVMFIGAAPMAVLIYELCFSFFVLFKHAKINIYPRLENLLNKLIVTPALHRQHHSDRLDYQNANYGVCLIVWDRMFNTFKLRTLNESHLEYGLEGFFNKKARQAISLMMFPFKSKKLKDKPNNYYPKRRSGDIPSERINE